MANPKSRSWYSGDQDAGSLTVDRVTAALPQTTTDVLFTVSGGPVLLKAIIGIVTVQVGAVANDTKLTHVATDVCAVLDVTGDTVGTRYSITGTFANALIGTASGVPVAVQATEVVLPVGDLIIDCAGSDGGDGRVSWSVVYVPLSEDATVVAA